MYDQHRDRTWPQHCGNLTLNSKKYFFRLTHNRLDYYKEDFVPENPPWGMYTLCVPCGSISLESVKLVDEEVTGPLSLSLSLRCEPP